MTVSELKDKLGLKIFSGEQGLNNIIDGGYTSDLLSDVMGHADSGNIWITLQTHKNIMAIASLKELAAIVLVKNFEPDAETIEHSNEEGIPILGSSDQSFEISGKIFNLIN
jgi:serine kinase of HPr protein (carbohydrate metabolism regulator)